MLQPISMKHQNGATDGLGWCWLAFRHYGIKAELKPLMLPFKPVGGSHFEPIIAWLDDPVTQPGVWWADEGEMLRKARKNPRSKFQVDPSLRGKPGRIGVRRLRHAPGHEAPATAAAEAQHYRQNGKLRRFPSHRLHVLNRYRAN